MIHRYGAKSCTGKDDQDCSRTDVLRGLFSLHILQYIYMQSGSAGVHW